MVYHQRRATLINLILSKRPIPSAGEVATRLQLAMPHLKDVLHPAVCTAFWGPGACELPKGFPAVKMPALAHFAYLPNLILNQKHMPIVELRSRYFDRGESEVCVWQNGRPSRPDYTQLETGMFLFAPSGYGGDRRPIDPSGEGLAGLLPRLAAVPPSKEAVLCGPRPRSRKRSHQGELRDGGSALSHSSRGPSPSPRSQSPLSRPPSRGSQRGGRAGPYRGPGGSSYPQRFPRGREASAFQPRPAYNRGNSRPGRGSSVDAGPRYSTPDPVEVNPGYTMHPAPAVAATSGLVGQGRPFPFRPRMPQDYAHRRGQSVPRFPTVTSTPPSR